MRKSLKEILKERMLTPSELKKHVGGNPLDVMIVLKKNDPVISDIVNRKKNGYSSTNAQIIFENLNR